MLSEKRAPWSTGRPLPHLPRSLGLSRSQANALRYLSLAAAILLLSYGHFASQDQNVRDKPSAEASTIRETRRQSPSGSAEPEPFCRASKRQGRHLPTSECFFAPSNDPLPVHHDGERLLYHNHPNSVHRARHQFSGCSTPDLQTKPVVTIITATRNAGEHFETTFANVRSQSLQPWRWIIVDDHSDDPTGLERLEYAAHADPRVHLVRNTGVGGLPASRNIGLEMVKHDPEFYTPYVLMLDDDDLFELTTLEKAVWMLESNLNWSIASYHFIKFGWENVTEIRGVHDGAANYYIENFVANAALIRTDDIGTCSYDLDFKTGGEDWDFWLCLAEQGKWGGTLPEMAYWYRSNEPSFRQSRWGDTFTTGHDGLKEHIHNKHAALDAVTHSFPSPAAVPTADNPPAIRLTAPFDNPIPDTACSGSVMIIVPWLAGDVAGEGAVRVTEILSKSGYRVTLVSTLYEPPASIALRPEAMQWTHDYHTLPAFLRPEDHPRYITYLALSRNIDTIVLSRSMLAYDLLPALREQLPDTAFIEYLDAEITDEVANDFLEASRQSQAYLDRTIASSDQLKEWLVERGHAASSIGVLATNLALELEQAHNIHNAPRSEETNYGRPDLAPLLAVQRGLRDNKPAFDLAETQEKLLPKRKRKGIGATFQQHCGDSESQTAWMDAMEKPRACHGEDSLDVRALQDSALSQCGAWCIWDLRTKEAQGWQFNGQCFVRMKGHACQEWLPQRPKTPV